MCVYFWFIFSSSFPLSNLYSILSLALEEKLTFMILSMLSISHVTVFHIIYHIYCKGCIIGLIKFPPQNSRSLMKYTSSMVVLVRNQSSNSENNIIKASCVYFFLPNYLDCDEDTKIFWNSKREGQILFLFLSLLFLSVFCLHLFESLSCIYNNIL